MEGEFMLLEYDLNSGDLVHLIDTTPIGCQSLRSVDDGTLLCLGSDVRKSNAHENDYDLIYRFGQDGTLLESSLPRAGFPEKPYPISSTRETLTGFLPGGEDEARLLLPSLSMLISFDSDGTVCDRITLPGWPIPEGLTEVRSSVQYAIAPSGDVVAMRRVGDAKDRGSWTQSLFRLTADDTTWGSAQGSPPQIPLNLKLVGANDEGLILLDKSTWSLVWYPLTTE
jgi:hypothetical protein